MQSHHGELHLQKVSQAVTQVIEYVQTADLHCNT